ncbi:hypothetical protein N8630_02600 [Synechococcus sp. AH-601-C19]|nr:hypothetical protein [Synechococcus sp. AH-601-C19]
METTDSIQSAIEQIIAPSQEETGETNQVEEETSVAPEAQEAEVEAVEETEELDELEVSDEELLDADIEATDIEEETVEPEYYTVKADGKEETVTIDQLKQSYSGQSAINKRFQEVAEARKQIEQKEAEISQMSQMLTQMNAQAQQQGFMSQPQLPDHTLAESDPISYMEQRAKYDADMQSYQQQQMQMQQLQQQQRRQADEQHQSFVAEQAEIIRGKIPELADPAKSQTHWQSLMGSAKEYGFSDEEIAATADARYIQMANDAMKFRRIVANRKKAEAKGKNVKPVVKAGAKRVADPEGSLKRKQFQKLQKTGRMEDAIDLIMKT